MVEKELTCVECGRKFKEGSNWYSKVEITGTAQNKSYINVPGTRYLKKTFYLCCLCSRKISLQSLRSKETEFTKSVQQNEKKALKKQKKDDNKKRNK